MKERRSRIAHAGFTLFEVLLVVVIIGIAAGVAIPMFAQSFRGAKLRNSIRTVLMVHRHAQSKAVLGQRYMVILFDELKNTVELADQGQPGEKKDAFFKGVGGGAPAGGVMGAVAEGGAADLDAPTETASALPNSVLTRKLEKGVKIESFVGGREIDGIYFVSYYPNGMCEQYEIRIGDGDGQATIRVDPVTGKAKVKRE